MGLKRRRIALAIVALVLVGFGVWYFTLRGPTDDPGRWQGEWQLLVPAGADKDRTPTPRRVPNTTVRVAGDRWVYVVGDKRRIWVAGQRFHHGFTGVLLASMGVAGLAARRLTPRGGAEWALLGTVLMAHDWNDRTVWFQVGSQE